MNYKFSILRYYHDIVSEEFLNVGVVLYVPEICFLEFKHLNKFSRIKKSFLDADTDYLKKLLHNIDFTLIGMSNNLKKINMFDKENDFKSFIDKILPIEDSSLRFSKEYFGITDDPQKTLDYLFDRFINKYVEKPEKYSRDNEEVWKVFRKPLCEKNVIDRLQPHKIITKDYEHNFEYCWQNDIWHINEPVSLDLKEGNSILEKANTWLGRATSLSEKNDFKLYLLLGKPENKELMKYFTKAENIMNKMPCKHEFITEDDAEKFAEELSLKMNSHEK